MTLIACPVQFVAADHLKPGIGIYKDETNVNLISIRDTKLSIIPPSRSSKCTRSVGWYF